MYSFLRYIKEQNITNILQIDSGTGPFKYLFQIIRTVFNSIWILVMTENKEINRNENRKMYEVIYNSYETYANNYLRFDMVLLSVNKSWNIKKLKELGKRVVFYAPMNFKEESISKEFTEVHIFYNLHKNLEWLPTFIKLYLSEFKIFADKSYKLIVGVFDEDIN